MDSSLFPAENFNVRYKFINYNIISTLRPDCRGSVVVETEKRAKITVKTIYYNFVLLGVNIR